MYVWDKEWIFWGNLQNKERLHIRKLFSEDEGKIMAEIIICSDFGDQENKIYHCFHFSPFYLPLSNGTIFHDLSLWMLNFKPAFSLSSFTLLKRLFSSSSLSAIRMLSSAYLRLLIFLLAILIPACDSSSLASPKMYSAYKVHKRCDNIQPCHISFPILNHSIVPCPILTVASWPTHRFLRRQVRWSGTPISLRIFTLLWSTQSKAFNNAEVDVFVEVPWFLHKPMSVGSLISVSSVFSKPSLYIWKFFIHILLKPSLRDFEHKLASIRSNCNCMVVWTFFGIVLLWGWNENWPFPVLKIHGQRSLVGYSPWDHKESDMTEAA